MTLHHYRAFDLVFSSPEAIPSLAGSAVHAPATVDVEIVVEPVTVPPGGETSDEMRCVARDGDIFLEIAESGAYRVQGGRRISVQPEPGVPSEQIHLFLLGSVFGAILHQRGLLPMHCNAIEHDGRAFLFCGDSGAGKSTLAAHFQRRGYRLLTDDVCALRFSDGAITALPGIARLKLWQESLDLLGVESAGLTQLPWRVEKFELPVAAAALAAPLPIAAMYHLRDTQDGRAAGIHRLTGLGAANTVTANIYRRRMADMIGGSAAYLAMAMRVAGSVPVFSLNRTWGLDLFAAEAAAAERHMQNFVDANAL